MKAVVQFLAYSLQELCVIEVFTIAVFTLLNCYEIYMFFICIEKLPEFAIVALMSFNAASFKIIEKCLNSINIGYVIDKD